MFRHLLMPTDGSELSEKMARSGLRLAKTLDAKVTGIYAVPRSYLPFYNDAAVYRADVADQVSQELERAGRHYLERLQQAAAEAGVLFEQVLARDKDPWRAIVDTAAAKGCDLIIMAAHGRRGLSALVLGSETQKVLTHSAIPVLVFR